MQDIADAKKLKELTDAQDAICNHTDLILLATLEAEPRHGYGICKRIAAVTAGECEMNEQTLYSALRRLEKNGAIETFFCDDPKFSKRKYYRLTETGKALLAAKKSAWADEKRLVDVLLRQSPSDSQNGEKND